MSIGKLSAVAVKQAKPADKPYKMTDGGGMYLLVDVKGGKYWRMNYRFAGKRKTLALGAYPPTVWLKPAKHGTRPASYSRKTRTRAWSRRLES